VIAAEIWGPEAGGYVHEGGPFGVLSLLPYVPAFLGLFLIGSLLHEPRPPDPAPTGTPSAPEPMGGHSSA